MIPISNNLTKAPLLWLIPAILCVLTVILGKQSQATEKTTIMKESLAKQTDSIVLGAGCFWGAEKRYQAIPGVITAVSGYADGRNIEPTYRTITQAKHKNNPDNFAEVVKVTYDPQKVSLHHIIKNYFEGHDPTQLNRQGNDIGTQYRSTILYHNETQQRIAKMLAQQYQERLTEAGYGKITTLIKPLEKFYPAEDYHQDYLAKNPNGYCPNHATGVTFEQTNNASKIDNAPLLSGKHIVILEAPFCPYCEQFKKNVAKHYQGEIPLHYRQAEQLNDLTLKTPTWATPTIFFLDNGKEVFARQGYMTPKEFYQALGLFQLGKASKAYEIAFEDGTESRFCKRYDLFKNAGDGVFIDTLSGEPLFDSKDRFNSGSGWLSFTKAIDGSVTEKPDNRFGMKRIEVRAKTSGIHLGHVFEDGPAGSRRFCINANVLTFKPRKNKSTPE